MKYSHEDRAWCLEVKARQDGEGFWYRVFKGESLISAIRNGTSYVETLERKNRRKVNLIMRLINTSTKEEIPWDIL